VLIDVSIETRSPDGEDARDVAVHIGIVQNFARQAGWALVDMELHRTGYGHRGRVTFRVDLDKDISGHE